MLEVVDAGDEVFREVLKGKVSSGLHFAFCAILQVAVVCDGAEIFVLMAMLGKRSRR